MKILAIKCKNCLDIIYSRARHDFRSCSCGKVSIDGGFDYSRIVAEPEDFTNIEIEIPVTKYDLYKDWNNKIDSFGLIKGYKEDERKQPSHN